MNKQVKQTIHRGAIGYVGLGKMGLAQVERLLEKGYYVFAK